MGRRTPSEGLAGLRALPRVFVQGADPSGEIDLPSEEVDKLRKVLRLAAGAEIVVLPNDGTLIRCTFGNRVAIPQEVIPAATDSEYQVTVAQALPKGDKLDEIVRACTEIGVAKFLLFPSERTVVRWDDKKTASRVSRLEAIAREAAEVCFRSVLPTFELAPNLESVLNRELDAQVLSEVEGLSPRLKREGTATTIVIGPEGGWARKELDWIGDRGVTLGPRVLRVEHAAPAAAAILLLA